MAFLLLNKQASTKLGWTDHSGIREKVGWWVVRTMHNGYNLLPLVLGLYGKVKDAPSLTMPHVVKNVPSSAPPGLSPLDRGCTQLHPKWQSRHLAIPGKAQGWVSRVFFLPPSFGSWGLGPFLGLHFLSVCPWCQSFYVQSCLKGFPSSHPLFLYFGQEELRSKVYKVL